MMAIASSLRDRAAMAVCGAAWVALFAGCTMCPDPLDYAGPVPGGSAAQNDFRARSNGILPLGVAPKPWPPVVQASGEVPGDPVSSEPEAEAAPDDFADDASDQQEPAAVVTVDVEADVAGEPAAEAAEGVEPAGVEEPFPDILPPQRPPRPLRFPTLRESLGWKPRG